MKARLRVNFFVVQNYFSSASELHSKEIKGLFMTLIGKLKKPTEDERDESCELHRRIKAC